MAKESILLERGSVSTSLGRLTILDANLDEQEELLAKFVECDEAEAN